MKSIGLKLWAGLMVLVVIMLLLLWLFQIVFLESFYTSMRIQEVKKSAYSLARDFEVLGSADFQNSLDAFSYNNNLSLEILDFKGNTLYSGTAGVMGHMPMMYNSAQVDAFRQVSEGKEASISLVHPRFGNKFMLIGLPITLKAEIKGAFFIYMPLAPVEDTVSILKRQMIYITFLLLACAVIISLVISRAFTKPILEIKKASEKMALGDFSERIENFSSDEIGELAKAINHMGQELSKIEELRKDFIANVSHELRTPLSLIRGYAETIRDVSGNVPQKRDKQLEIIIEEAERLGRIVDDILNLSQIQAGYMNLEVKPFAINDLVERVIKRFALLSEKRGIEMKIEAIGDMKVKADEARIEQVLYNLLSNAFNHTGMEDTITVKLLDKGSSIRVEVCDTGTGIPEEDIKHIWDRYYKADKKREGKMLGTGLGLAIVKSVLQAHDVLFGVESKMEAGTTFWFELQK